MTNREKHLLESLRRIASIAGQGRTLVSAAAIRSEVTRATAGKAHHEVLIKFGSSAHIKECVVFRDGEEIWRGDKQHYLQPNDSYCVEVPA